MMAKLIYSAIASADGYIEDPDGSIDWGMPDEELLGFINELEQPARTYLYGRRMYEAMLYWETAHTTVQPRLFQEFTGIWQAAEKIVFSKTLASVSSARTRVEPAFEPGLVRQLKAAAEHDMRVGVRAWPGRPSRPGWPTRCGYSWFLLSSEVASERFPTASAQIWSYWIRSGSPAVLSTSGTASSQTERWCRSGRPWP
jgi:dihydrofolate reductase